MRRYREDDLARVTRIRELQALLGLDLDAIAVVLRGDDRLAEIRAAWYQEHTSADGRRELARESLQLQEELRATVAAKREAIDRFLADLDARIAKTRELVAKLAAPADPVASLAWPAFSCFLLGRPRLRPSFSGCLQKAADRAQGSGQRQRRWR
jgi:DNA-binding transcriptional MerR regulator